MLLFLHDVMSGFSLNQFFQYRLKKREYNKKCSRDELVQVSVVLKGKLYGEFKWLSVGVVCEVRIELENVVVCGAVVDATVAVDFTEVGAFDSSKKSFQLWDEKWCVH
jgi:hypothetical protein